MSPVSPPTKPINLTVLGGGYTGAAIAKYFHSLENFRVQVTTTREERIPELESIGDRVVIAKGEDPLNLRNLLEFQDVIISCVAPIGDRQVDADTYRSTYIPLTKNLHRALKFHPRPQQLIYLSSSSVYGNHQGQWVTETSATDRTNPYNQVLNEAEENLLIPPVPNSCVTILRLGGIYGEGYELIRRFKRLAGETMPSTGKAYSAWIHLEDIIHAIHFLIKNPRSGVINLVNDFDMTMQELSNKIADLGKFDRILWDDSKPSYRPLNARISNQKIKQLGYQLRHPQTIL